MSSTSLYDTFGNEIRFDVLRTTLNTFLENATIKFPLPEATSEILGNLGEEDLAAINPDTLNTVRSNLEALGFQAANAKALSIVLIRVAEIQGVHPLEYFNLNESTLKLTKDAYTAINGLRPVGNRVGLAIVKKNSSSAKKDLIKP